jgi:hypothetical protein
MSLALDYCVKYSKLDARQLGLNTFVIVDGCRGIELKSGDIDRALDQMKDAGANPSKKQGIVAGVGLSAAASAKADDASRRSRAPHHFSKQTSLARMNAPNP